MLLACDKPSGISSFDVVKIIRTHFQEKVWHSGTLDPLASGLMILGVGKGTKELTNVIWLNKSYETIIDFSLLTDTRDANFWEKEERFEVVSDPLFTEESSSVLQPPVFATFHYQGNYWSALLKDWKTISAPHLDQIKHTLDQILYKAGEETLLPLPPFCAKKQQGKRLYKDARKGTAEIQNKPMKLYQYEILQYQFPLLSLRLAVGSWTYIRSISYWLGQQLGLGWALIALRRTSIGDIQLSSLGTEQFAKGRIKGQERIIYFKEILV